MPAKTVELHERSRVGIVKGATLVMEAARVTLGPKGRNVMIQRSFGSPTITKDGATVVKEIELENRFENMGAKLIREVAQKTSDVAGDGTTTATVLAARSYGKVSACWLLDSTRWNSSAVSMPRYRKRWKRSRRWPDRSKTMSA